MDRTACKSVILVIARSSLWNHSPIFEAPAAVQALLSPPSTGTHPSVRKVYHGGFGDKPDARCQVSSEFSSRPMTARVNFVQENAALSGLDRHRIREQEAAVCCRAV
jgi:hypothetical protein